MAQSFISTYKIQYRWPDPQVTLPIVPNDNFISAIPPEDIWITATEDDKLDAEFLEKRLRRCYLKRMITTYRMAYCRDMVAKIIGEPMSSSFEDQLLEYARNLYEPESRPKIAQPIAGSRKTFGYIRPTLNYTPLTDYQHSIGESGYKILRGDYRKVQEKPQDIPVTKEIQGDHGNKKGKEEKKVDKICDCYCCTRIAKGDNK